MQLKDSGIRQTIRIQNPISSTVKDWNRVNPWSGIQNPRLSFISLHDTDNRYPETPIISYHLLSNDNRPEWNPIRSVIIRVITQFLILIGSPITKLQIPRKRNIAKL